MSVVGDLPVLTLGNCIKGWVIKWPVKLYAGLRFLTFLTFFSKSKKHDFLRFGGCCTRFLQHWVWWFGWTSIYLSVCFVGVSVIGLTEYALSSRPVCMSQQYQLFASVFVKLGCRSSNQKGQFWCGYGVPHCNLGHSCAKVHEVIELPFGAVSGSAQASVNLMGSTYANGGHLGFSPHRFEWCCWVHFKQKSIRLVREKLGYVRSDNVSTE